MSRPLLALLLGLSACSQPVSQSANDPVNLEVPTASCEANNNPICSFFNAPLILLSTPIRLLMRKETFYPMANELEFIDSSRKTWIAPKGTLTDGASIPHAFVPVVGEPTSKEFVNAAAIHDAYCGIGNEKLPQYHSERWQDVHRMFYDALRVGGTPPKKAKIMFAAVYIGGPRWSLPRRNSSQNLVTKSQHLPNLQFSTKSSTEPLRSRDGIELRKMGVPTSKLLKELQAAIEFITKEEPSIAALERFLLKRESEYLDQLGLTHNRLGEADGLGLGGLGIYGGSGIYGDPGYYGGPG